MDIPNPLSPHLFIVHCFRQILRATSRIGTELLYVGSSWTSCLCLSMSRGLQGYRGIRWLITLLYTSYFLLLMYLSRISGLLSGTSLSGLGFILFSNFTSVFINGHRDFVFWHLYSPKFSRQLQCHFRHPFVTRPWTAFINSNCSVVMTEPTNHSS